ncbi:MFS transporter, partial [Desulfovibrio sp. OttesenSCG-928-O18]|nr:MFS transporter [Desulfovibrio sp. OttesenSCG-928-O18]
MRPAAARRNVSIPLYFWFPVLGSIGLGFFFMNIPPVADQFMTIFGVGYAGLSFFLSAIYWTHSLVQVPAGIFIDRIGAVRSLILCLAICFVCSAAPFLAPDNLWLASLLRLVLGAGTGALFLAMVKVAKILTPPNHIARVQGAQGAAFCCGTMLPYLTLPWAGAYGWVAAYLSGAVFCAVYALTMLRLPRERLRQGPSSATLVQVWAALKIIATSKHIWFLGACHGFAYGSLNTIGNWLPSMLADRKPGTTLEDWAIATSVMLLIGTAARILGGEASRFMPRRVLLCRVVLIIGVFYWAMATATSPLPLLTLAVILAFICGATYASVFTLAIDMAEPAYVATAVGFMNMVAN